MFVDKPRQCMLKVQKEDECDARVSTEPDVQTEAFENEFKIPKQDNNQSR